MTIWGLPIKESVHITGLTLLACLIGAGLALLGVVLPLGSAQPGQGWLGAVDLTVDGVLGLVLGYLFCLFVIGWYAVRVEKRFEWPMAVLGVIWTVALVAGKWVPGLGASPVRVIASVVLAFPFLCVLARDGMDWLDLLRARGRNAGGMVGKELTFGKAFLVYWLVIALCWVAVLVMLYPGCIAPNDTVDQLQQFYGIESHTSQMAGQIVPGVYLNNHHPVAHTLLLGSFVELGRAIGSIEAGLFAFVLMQILIASAALAFGFASARSAGVRRVVVIVCLLVAALVPIVPVLMCNLSKDGMFTAFFLWVFVLVARIGLRPSASSRGRSIARALALVVCVAGMCLMRSTGIYIAAFALPFLIVYDVRHHRRIAIACACGLAIVLVMNQAVFPAAGITAGSSDEKWAIPFQQIALCFIEHGDELSDEQRTEIDRVLDADTLAQRYDPYNADPVKNTREHSDATAADGRTAKLWLELLGRYPATCLQAYLPLCKEYFDPLSKDRALWFHLDGFYLADGTFVDESARLEEFGVEAHESGIGFAAREMAEKKFAGLLGKSIFTFLSLGSYAWAVMLLACYVLARRESWMYAPLVFAVLLMATLLLSPALGLVRYGLPLYCVVPLSVASLVVSPGHRKIATSAASSSRV